MTIYDVVNATEISKAYVESVLRYADNLKTDPDKIMRLSKQNCVYCFYSSRIGGAAITSRKCKNCGKEEMYGSTNTDALCTECSKRLKLCKHCGGDIEMKRRRKLDV